MLTKSPRRFALTWLFAAAFVACEDTSAVPPPPPPPDDVALDVIDVPTIDVTIDDPPPLDLGEVRDVRDVPPIDRPDAAPDRPPPDVPGDLPDVVVRRCMADADCDDRVACTEDACRGGVCANTSRNSRCGDGQWCDLARGCTTGRMCATDRDCVSTNPCESDGFCAPSTSRCVFFTRDDDRDGVASFACGGTDCNDGSADERPGGTERCNGRDDNCNGAVDEDPERALCGGGSCVGGACTCGTAGLTFCSGTCVNTMTDRAHCGRCGNPCGDAFNCVAGRCQCAPTSIACGIEMCVNTRTSTSHCGACSRPCAATLSCNGGVCGCAPGETMCGARCVNTMTDRLNCGMCSRSCGLVPCEGGVCRCPTGQTMCGSTCVDLNTDPRNCGMCGVACGAGMCAAGACACTGTARNCPGVGCIDTATNRLHCGACGNACRTDQTCTASACACFTGSMECGGRCVNVTFDVLNCGACGNACPGGSAVSTCSASTCICRTGTLCGTGASATCADFTSDSENCGGCGMRCPATQVCTAGRCGCPTGASTVCGTACTNVTINPANCGACGTVCRVAAGVMGAEAVCAGSRCATACTAGRGDCDGNAANGCEADLTTNRAHCGACGRACAAGAVCTAGTCPGEVWARSVGGLVDDRATHVATDVAGNVFVGGVFSLNVTFGAGTISSAGGNDGFVASIDPRGSPRWIRRVGGTSTESVNDVAVDAAGNVYVVGSSFGPADLGDGVTTVLQGSGDMFVVSFTNAGAFRWAHRFGSRGDDSANGVAVDGAGNVYVAGYASSTLTVGTTRIAATSADGVVIGLTNAGAVRWAAHLAGPGTQSFTSIAATAAGDLVATANFDTNATLGTAMLTSLGSTDAVVIGLTSTGTLRWTRAIGGVNTEFLTRVQVDAMGNAVVAGRFDSPSIVVGTDTLTNGGSAFITDAFVATLTPAGAVRWARRIGGTSTDLGSDATFDAMGNVWFAGTFRISADLGMGAVAAQGADGFLVQYTAEGVVRSAQRYGGASEDELLGVRAVPGAVVIAGHFTLNAMIGATTLTSMGSRDVFAARVVP